MSNIKNWSTTPASNSSAPPQGAPEGMAPSTVNNTMRQQMADHRTQWEDAQWFDWGHVPVFQGVKSFMVSSTCTQIYTANRRLKLYDASTILATVVASAPSGANTVISITSSDISASLTSLAVSIINPAEPPILWPTNRVHGADFHTTAGAFTWTAPIGVYQIWMTGCGGGGGGGGNNGAGCGAGGGAGEWCYKLAKTVVPGTTYNGVIGTGGAGGAAAAGSAGVNTTFDTLTLNSGSGGTSEGAGGAGGTGGGAIAGGSGGNGSSDAGTGASGGSGLFAGGPGSLQNGVTAGGFGGGGGGGGGSVGTTGGNGAGGYFLIEY